MSDAFRLQGDVYPDMVEDQNGAIHRLRYPPLGQGGQGVVFRTHDPDTAVKFMVDARGAPRRNDEFCARVRRRVDEIMTLPLPKHGVASPHVALSPPYAGYVMRLLNDMVPISALIAKPNQSVANVYRETGGLRRRLRVLEKAASVIARLHATPLVYGDVSDRNIFVSQDVNFDEAWLIDLDNVRYWAESSDVIIYTPGFGSPEVVQSRAGVTTLSDTYAFAVLAFQVLSQQHPFLGSAAEEGGGWDADGDKDPQDDAFAGRLPWIDDPTTDENRSANGIPRAMVLTPSLRELFRKCFCEGRLDRTKRPSMAAFVESLGQAANFTVDCNTCESSFLPFTKKCPWCEVGVATAWIRAQSRTWVPDLDDESLGYGSPESPTAASRSGCLTSSVQYSQAIVAHPGRRVSLAAALLRPVVSRESEPSTITMAIGRAGITLDVPDDVECHYVDPQGGNCERVVGRKDLDLRSLGHLHVGDMGQPHRVVSLRYVPKE
jgi:serine/threonine protein kinase